MAEARFAEDMLQCSCGTRVHRIPDLFRHKRICDDRVCVICYERLSAVTLEPCLHSRFRADCVNKLMKIGRTCPYCRSTVTSTQGEGVVNIFDPILERAGRLAITNNTVGTQEEALANLEWDLFLADIRGDQNELAFLAEVRQYILEAWTLVVERAQHLVAPVPMDIDN